jgi:hypothetical protein
MLAQNRQGPRNGRVGQMILADQPIVDLDPDLAVHQLCGRDGHPGRGLEPKHEIASSRRRISCMPTLQQVWRLNHLPVNVPLEVFNNPSDHDIRMMQELKGFNDHIPPVVVRDPHIDCVLPLVPKDHKLWFSIADGKISLAFSFSQLTAHWSDSLVNQNRRYNSADECCPTASNGKPVTQTLRGGLFLRKIAISFRCYRRRQYCEKQTYCYSNRYSRKHRGSARFWPVKHHIPLACSARQNASEHYVKVQGEVA